MRFLKSQVFTTYWLMLRLNNPINVVQATIKGLADMRAPEQIAAKRGKSVDQILG